MENLKKLSLQNLRSVSNGWVTRSLSDGVSAPFPDHHSIEICNVLSSRRLIIDDSCEL
jgi:hypothetical protein